MIEHLEMKRLEDGVELKKRRRRITEWPPMRTIAFLTCYTSIGLEFAQSLSNYGNVPQHRIRKPNRHLSYNINHPWTQYGESSSDDKAAVDGRFLTQLKSSSTASILEPDVRQRVLAFLERPGSSNAQSIAHVGNNVDESISSGIRIDGDANTDINTSPTTKGMRHLSAEDDEFEYVANNATNSTTVHTTTSYTSDESQSLYQPIRIRASLTPHPSSGSEFLSTTQKRYLMDSIIQPAIDTWSRALSVIPVEGNLTIDRTQLYDGMSCGPGIDSGFASIVVPEGHLDGEAGVVDTDLMIYVGVSFYGSSDEEMLENDLSVAGDFQRADLPPKPLLTAASSFPEIEQPSTILRGSYEPDETRNDNILIEEDMNRGGAIEGESGTMDTTGSDESNHTRPVKPTCNGDYLASATYCSTDQYDRPVAGMIHFCIDPEFFDPSFKERHIVTAVHEVGHLLGFNIQSMAHFRNKEDGIPLTDRDENGDVPDVEVECTGIQENRGFATLPLPSENILKFNNVRNGVRVAQVVTPTVRQIARNQFNCQSLEGAELESEFFHPVLITDEVEDDGTSTSYESDDVKLQAIGECISSHWERRIFKSDLMNPVVDDIRFNSLISPLTLAYFMDSGWYEVDTSRAAHADSWGRGAGCSFVQSSCLTETGRVSVANSQFFCNSFPRRRMNNEYDGCTEDLSRKAMCSIIEYDSDLPFEYTYFSQTSSIESTRHGGDDPDLDYCPVYEGLSHGLCKGSDSETHVKVARMEEFGVSNSRCVVGQVEDLKTSLCVPIACVIADQTLRLRVDGIWQVCDYPGQQLPSWWNVDDFVVCPDPRRVCPTFYCAQNCLSSNHAGICDHDTGECLCPFTDENESNTTTPVSEFCSEPNSTSIKKDDLITVDSSMGEYYFAHANELTDDEKDIFDKTARMFRALTPGEIVLFTSLSLVLIVVCVIVTSFLVGRIKGEGTQDCTFSRFIENSFFARYRQSWRSDLQYDRFFGTGFYGGNRNKDKMVASVLVDMRLRDTEASAAQSTNANGYQDRVVYRSDLPPLPGAGRVLSVVGSRFIDDAMVPLDNHQESRSEHETASNTGTGLELLSNHNTSYTNDASSPSIGASTRIFSDESILQYETRRRR